MAAEVSPELRSRIENYLQTRSRGETALLLLLYKEVFGRDLNIKCGSCIEDGINHLKARIKQKNTMSKYKWIGDKKASVIIKTGLNTVKVTADNLNDTYGDIISSIPKYAHLVENTGESLSLQKIELTLKDGEVFKVVPPAEGAEDETPKLKTSEDITLTSIDVQNEEQQAKKKRGRPSSK